MMCHSDLLSGRKDLFLQQIALSHQPHSEFPLEGYLVKGKPPPCGSLPPVLVKRMYICYFPLSKQFPQLYSERQHTVGVM